MDSDFPTNNWLFYIDAMMESKVALLPPATSTRGHHHLSPPKARQMVRIEGIQEQDENNTHTKKKEPLIEHFPRTEEITMWRNPGYTLRYFGLAVYGALPKQWPWSLPVTLRVAVSVATLFILHHQGKRGALDSGDATTIRTTCVWLQNTVLETIFWIGCGVLSTIGLGSGIQTGAMFLFPHVCRLALAWSKQQQLQQQDQHLGSDDHDAPSLASLMWSVAIPGFWSGGGSAAGELVPFLLARVLRKSGRDPFALLNTGIPSPTKASDKGGETASTLTSSESHASFSSIESMTATASTVLDTEEESSSSHSSSSLSSSSSWRTPQLLLSNTRESMESQLSSNAFWKIFTLAVVPNALFDLAGLVCGASSDVCAWEFFLATWFAKAIVRTPAQTCGLALAVVAITSPGSLPMLLGSNFPVTGVPLQEPHLTKATAALAAASDGTSTVTRFLERWGRLALSEFVGGDEFLMDAPVQSAAGTASTSDEAVAVVGGSDDPSFVFGVFNALWTGMTVALFGFFVISTIEQVAQHHIRTSSDEIQINRGEIAGAGNQKLKVA